MCAVRISAKAVIIRDGRLLVTKNADLWGFFYLLPGGGQEQGESLPVALQRECWEEIGVQVNVQQLLYVRDYVGSHHEFKVYDSDVHQVEIMFACTIADNAIPCNGPHPDPHQVAVEWLSIASLHQYRIYPRALVDVLQAQGYNGNPYLGDIN